MKTKPSHDKKKAKLTDRSKTPQCDAQQHLKDY